MQKIKFKGYASNYIVDSAQHCINRGAFGKNIDINNIKMYWEHDQTLCVGKWLSIYEDEIGLCVVGEIDLKHIQHINCAQYIANHKIADLSLSVGMYILESYKCNNYTMLTKVKLIEISLTRLPINSEAKIHTYEEFAYESRLI